MVMKGTKGMFMIEFMRGYGFEQRIEIGEAILGFAVADDLVGEEIKI